MWPNPQIFVDMAIYILKKSSMENFVFCAVIVKTTASPCDEIKQNEVNIICGNQASCS